MEGHGLGILRGWLPSVGEQIKYKKSASWIVSVSVYLEHVFRLYVCHNERRRRYLGWEILNEDIIVWRLYIYIYDGGVTRSGIVQLRSVSRLD